MQQIAESIVRVSKRVPRRRLASTPTLKLILEVAQLNRPSILKQRLKSNNSYQTQTFDDFCYLIEFDQMICLDEQWVDGETLRYLNSLRTNILVSSMNFDSIQLTDQ